MTDNRKTTNPRRIVLDWHYKPNLSFYAKMDQVGLSFGADFSDWRRQPLNLEVQDRTRFRRIYLSHNRSFFDSDGNPENAEENVNLAVQVARQINDQLGVEKCVRLGFRQWYALTFDQSRRRVVEKLASRFFVHNESVGKILGAEIRDLQYVVDLEEGDDGWAVNLRIGPMEISEWVELLEYRDKLQPGGVLSKPNALEQIKGSLPDPLIFMDIDFYRMDIAVGDVSDAVAAAKRRSKVMVRQLIEYYQSG